jgi:hypothetical protein
MYFSFHISDTCYSTFENGYFVCTYMSIISRYKYHWTRREREWCWCHYIRSIQYGSRHIRIRQDNKNGSILPDQTHPPTCSTNFENNAGSFKSQRQASGLNHVSRGRGARGLIECDSFSEASNFLLGF